MGRGTANAAWLLHFTLLYVPVSLLPPKLCWDLFTNGTCWKAFFGGKKANNVFCQAAKQPVKDTAFWLHYLKERGNWILTTILNPSPRGRIIKELGITLVITVYLDNGKIKNWVVHQKWFIIFIRACNTWFVNTERGLVGMFLRFGPRCSSNGLGNRGVSLDLLLLLASSNKASEL